MNYSPISLLTSDEETIKGWFIAKSDPRDSNSPDVRADRKLVVFFHENAGNIGLRLSYYTHLYRDASCDIVTVAYRGYSSSSGHPSEAGLKLDAQAVMGFVHTDLAQFYTDKGGIFVIGRSLGGAVAAHAVTNYP